jgi:hypothetical protein
VEKNFCALKGQKLIKNLNIVSGTFMTALTQRKYSKARSLASAHCLAPQTPLGSIEYGLWSDRDLH